MTNEELKTYYADLLISQYKQKPKAYAMIKAVIDILLMNQLPLTAKDAYDLETAVGSQLDTVGKYQGVTRYSRGLNGSFVLDDTDFRNLIKMAIVKNSSNSSLSTIQYFLYTYFPNQIFVFDDQAMRMHYLIDIGTENLMYAFINELLLPRPTGVQLTGIFYVDSVPLLFGFRNYVSPSNGVGLNSYTDYQTNTHFLSNKDIIS